jgi:predicted ATP-binding protein involved in virulence
VTPLFNAWHPVIDALPYSVISFDNVNSALVAFQDEITRVISDIKKADNARDYILQSLFTDVSLDIWSTIVSQTKNLTDI